jgi:protein ImuB
LKFEVRNLKFHIAIIERWGVHTLGELARLPRADLHARLGPVGVRLHQAACGEDATPLVPAGEAVRWIERVECDWPIEGLEPLSFVLARICETLSGRLERADRGAVEVTTRLQLVTREVHTRTLHLPAPMRDARGLRTLMLLDLESHPPGAAIDVVDVELGVAPGRIVHGSLLARAVPAPEDLATLTARLGALMGESRIGAPALVDTHDERAVGMVAFKASDRAEGKGQRAKVGSLPCLRRFRLPIAARVVVEHHTPVRVIPSARGLAGGDVIACAGPWRTSGRWWALDRTEWDRDVWDVELADAGVYRLARHRASGHWEIEGAID